MEASRCQFQCVHDEKIYLNQGLGNICYNLNVCDIRMSDIPLNVKFLKPGMSLNVKIINNMAIIDIEPTETFYFNIVYDFIETSASEYIFICKKIDISNEVKKIRLSNIYSIETNQVLQIQDPVKIISRPILTDLSSEKNWFILNEAQMNSKPNMRDFFQRGQKSIVKSTSKHHIHSESNQSMTIADFYFYNKISHDIDLRYFINQPVEIIEKEKRYYFKLINIRKKVTLVENFSADLQSNKDNKLVIPKGYEKLRYPMQWLSLNLKRELVNSYISPEIFNKNLGALIGLAIVEHMFRFQNDDEFYKYCEEIFNKNGILQHFRDLQHPSTFKDIPSLHEYFSYYSERILMIGNAFKPKIFEIGSLKSIQELSNTTQCCIHYYDFSEGFEEYRLIPVKDVKNRPIIKLGRYFSEYFLIYSDKDMAIDGFDPNSYSYYPFNKHQKKNNSFYDNINDFDFNCLDILIESIAVKLKKMSEKIVQKIKGQSYYDSDDFGFDQEIEMFNESMLKQFDIPPLPSIKSLREVNLTQAVYLVMPKKYCCCHCGLYFIENAMEKSKFSCNHEYAKKHLDELFINMCPICNKYPNGFNMNMY